MFRDAISGLVTPRFSGGSANDADHKMNIGTMVAEMPMGGKIARMVEVRNRPNALEREAFKTSRKGAKAQSWIPAFAGMTNEGGDW